MKPTGNYLSKKSPEYLTKQFDSKLPKGYTRLSPYVNQKTPVTIKHSCGKSANYLPASFTRGSRCTCEHKRVLAYTHEDYVARAAVARPGFKVEGEYRGTKTKIWHRHVDGCGKRFQQIPDNFLAGRTCPACESAKFQSRPEPKDVAKKLETLLGKGYKVLSCGAMKDSAKIKHMHCGNVFDKVAARLINDSTAEVPCPFCRKGIGKKYQYQKNGKRFLLQGTERSTLDEICRIWKLSGPDVLHGQQQVPKIAYRMQGRDHLYYPDFYVPTLNLIIESKDKNSLGLGTWFLPDVYERNCAKAKAVIASGFHFKMVVFNAGKRLILPRNWFTLTRAQLCAELKLA